MLTDEQKRRFNEDLPSSVVREREGGGRKALSYVEGWYIIDRMNSILGPGGWSYDCTPTLAVSKMQSKDGKDRWAVTYTAKCVLAVDGCTIGDYGAGHGIDRDEGAAHESAIKEACTDALKRCAKSLGRSMGLALYDKTQEHVASAADALMAELANASTMDEVNALSTRASDAVRGLGQDVVAQVRAAFTQARERLTKGQQT